MQSVTVRIEGKPSSVWTTLDDWAMDGGLTHKRGIDGDEPLSVTANSGEAQFNLRNHANNSVHTAGRYSPSHRAALPGLDQMPVRTVYTWRGRDYVGWTGKLADIDADPDAYGPRQARCTAYDHMHDLVEADIREIAPQINQTDSAIIGAILDALPASAQPPARSIEAGLDTFAYALDRIGAKSKAVTALGDVTKSTVGILFSSATGTATYKTRQTRFSQASLAHLDEDDYDRDDGITVKSAREARYNGARFTYHPKHTASTTLWEASGTPTRVSAGETIELWVTYRDPDDLNRLIGAQSVTPPVRGTDYIANSEENGSGTVTSADITITCQEFVTTAKLTIVNAGSVESYLTTNKLRGTGIFDEGSPTVESRTDTTFERVYEEDLKYQGDRYVAYGMATLVRDQRLGLTSIVTGVKFLANRSAHLMKLALTAEVGDLITVSNAMSGISRMTCVIQNIEFEVSPGFIVHVRFGLAPSSTITVPPAAPTSLAVATASDTELAISWLNSDASAETEIYANGSFYARAIAGATSVTVGDFTRATNYSITLKHVKYSLIRSTATAGITGRPTVVATGGTITTDATYKYHTFTTSNTFAITKGGRVSILLVGGGGGGGDSGDVSVGGGGGGAGDARLFIDNVEPVGSYGVVIGGGGAGSTADSFGVNGSDTTYRSQGAVGGGGGGSYPGTSVNGRAGGCGGGGSGDNGVGGAGDFGEDGGSSPPYIGGASTGGGGGGQGGVGGAGVAGGGGGAVGGAGGTGISAFGLTVSTGGRGGGPGGGFGGNGANYGDGGDGIYGAFNAGAGKQGIAVFRYPI